MAKLVLIFMMLWTHAARATTLCPDTDAFLASGWEQPEVQDAMDDYLRDHRIRVNWQQEPQPPNAVGRDYYEWLWIDEFGAAMKAELVDRFCSGRDPEQR